MVSFLTSRYLAMKSTVAVLSMVSNKVVSSPTFQFLNSYGNIFLRYVYQGDVVGNDVMHRNGMR